MYHSCGDAVFKRITIKVEESNFAVCTSAPLALPRYGKRVVPCDVDIPVSPTSMPSKRQKQKKSVEKSNTTRSVSATFDAGGERLRARLPDTSFTRVIDGKLFKSQNKRKYANPANCYCKNVLLLRVKLSSYNDIIQTKKVCYRSVYIYKVVDVGIYIIMVKLRVIMCHILYVIWL